VPAGVEWRTRAIPGDARQATLALDWRRVLNAALSRDLAATITCLPLFSTAFRAGSRRFYVIWAGRCLTSLLRLREQGGNAVAA